MYNPSISEYNLSTDLHLVKGHVCANSQQKENMSTLQKKSCCFRAVAFPLRLCCFEFRFYHADLIMQCEHMDNGLDRVLVTIL